MHSIFDIIGGLLYALIICLILDQFSNWFYEMFQYGFMCGLISSLICVLLCFIYPTQKRWNPTRVDTFLIMGIASGLSLGLSLKFQLKIENIGKINFYDKDENVSDFEYKKRLALLVFLRSFIGLNLIFVAKIISKKIAISFIRLKLNLNKDTPEVDLKEILKKNYKLEIFYYYFCYFNISFTAVFTCFILFEYFCFI